MKRTNFWIINGIIGSSMGAGILAGVITMRILNDINYSVGMGIIYLALGGVLWIYGIDKLKRDTPAK